MREYERTALVERIERDGATVGASIPERLIVQGEEVDLRDRVFAAQTTATDGGATRTAIDELVVALRRERLERIDRIETDPELDRETAESIADRVIGIDRALGALAAATRDEDIEAQIQAKAVEDHARWRAFIQQTRSTTIDRRINR